MPQLYQDDPRDLCPDCDAELVEGEENYCDHCYLAHLRRLLADDAWCFHPQQGQRRNPLTGVREIDRALDEANRLEELLGDDRTEEQQVRDAEFIAYDMAACAAERR